MEGFDAEGQVGLWVKQLLDSAWKFERTDDAQLGKDLELYPPAYWTGDGVALMRNALLY